MLYNVEYISQYIQDEACEVCVGQCSIENDCPVALFRGNISVVLFINSVSHGRRK